MVPDPMEVADSEKTPTRKFFWNSNLNGKKRTFYNYFQNAKQTKIIEKDVPFL